MSEVLKLIRTIQQRSAVDGTSVTAMAARLRLRGVNELLLNYLAGPVLSSAEDPAVLPPRLTTAVYLARLNLIAGEISGGYISRLAAPVEVLAFWFRAHQAQHLPSAWQPVYAYLTHQIHDLSSTGQVLLQKQQAQIRRQVVEQARIQRLVSPWCSGLPVPLSVAPISLRSLCLPAGGQGGGYG